MRNGFSSIQVSSLRKIFPGPRGQETEAVAGISFSCKEGEIYGLLGPNGAGKTTTLRILATLLHPTSGTALVHGFDIAQESIQVRKSLAFLSSTTGLYPRLTAREILEFFGRLFGMRGSALTQRVEEVLHLLDMDSFAHVPCEKLSTGMKQRVSIGRSIIHDPPVWILDEPTSGLDVLAAAKTRDFLREARNRGKCILFSTHIMSEAESLCDRLGILHEGALWAQGSLEEIKEATGTRHLEDAFLHLIRNSSEGEVPT